MIGLCAPPLYDLRCSTSGLFLIDQTDEVGEGRLVERARRKLDECASFRNELGLASARKLSCCEMQRAQALRPAEYIFVALARGCVSVVRALTQR